MIASTHTETVVRHVWTLETPCTWVEIQKAMTAATHKWGENRGVITDDAIMFESTDDVIRIVFTEPVMAAVPKITVQGESEVVSDCKYCGWEIVKFEGDRWKRTTTEDLFLGSRLTCPESNDSRHHG